jgi:hypothetical protein
MPLRQDQGEDYLTRRTDGLLRTDQDIAIPAKSSLS